MIVSEAEVFYFIPFGLEGDLLGDLVDIKGLFMLPELPEVVQAPRERVSLESLNDCVGVADFQFDDLVFVGIDFFVKIAVGFGPERVVDVR